MNRVVALMSGVGLGAGLMYLLDPDSGGRRRAVARDKARHYAHAVGDAVGKTSRDLRHRTEGLLAQLRRLGAGPPPDDAIVIERVRSRMGHWVSHPRDIDVEAHQGRVILTGLVLAKEARKLLSAVASVRGVAEVEDHLDVRESFETEKETEPEAADAPREWPPAVRLAAGATALGLACYAARSRGFLRAGLGGLGVALLLRSLAPVPDPPMPCRHPAPVEAPLPH
jgi:hypothetical protein